MEQLDPNFARRFCDRVTGNRHKLEQEKFQLDRRIFSSVNTTDLPFTVLRLHTCGEYHCGFRRRFTASAK